MQEVTALQSSACLPLDYLPLDYLPLACLPLDCATEDFGDGMLESGTPTPGLSPLSQPEILEAILELRLQSYAASQTTQLVVSAEPDGLHLQLTDATCPDPLLMMNYLGETLAMLGDRSPTDRSSPNQPRRVRFSGGGRDPGSPVWIGFIDVAEFATAIDETPASDAVANSAASSAAPELRSPQDYERFITDQSSWFTPAVKSSSQLHSFAKATQHQQIFETAQLLAQTLAPDETLLDVFPVRYRRCASSFILTNRRLWCASESLKLQRPALQDLLIPLSELEQIEIAGNGLRIQEQRTDHRIYFSASDSQNLEILLAYFTRVVRRDVIPEASSPQRHRAASLGLAASILLVMGWTVAGVIHSQVAPVRPGQTVKAQGAIAPPVAEVTVLTSLRNKLKIPKSPPKLPPMLDDQQGKFRNLDP